MGFENFLSGFDFNEFLLNMGKLFLRIARVPFELWNKVPLPFRVAFYIFILLFAIALAIVTWKNKDAWRYRH